MANSPGECDGHDTYGILPWQALEMTSFLPSCGNDGFQWLGPGAKITKHLFDRRSHR